MHTPAGNSGKSADKLTEDSRGGMREWLKQAVLKAHTAHPFFSLSVVFSWTIWRNLGDSGTFD
jgi:hypothetical protein